MLMSLTTFKLMKPQSERLLPAAYHTTSTIYVLQYDTYY